MPIPDETRHQLAVKFAVLLPHLDERQRRLLMAAEARDLGHGGVRAVAQAAAVSETTVRKGVFELEAGEEPLGRVRRPGGGRRRVADLDPGLRPALLALVEPDVRGDPMSPLRWTVKSTRTLARELTRALRVAGRFRVFFTRGLEEELPRSVCGSPSYWWWLRWPPACKCRNSRHASRTSGPMSSTMCRTRSSSAVLLAALRSWGLVAAVGLAVLVQLPGGRTRHGSVTDVRCSGGSSAVWPSSLPIATVRLMSSRGPRHHLYALIEPTAARRADMSARTATCSALWR